MRSDETLEPVGPDHDELHDLSRWLDALPTSPADQESSARTMLAAVLESSSDGIVALRALRGADGTIADFRIIMISATAAGMLQRDATGLVGARLSRVRPDLPAERLARYAELVDTGGTWATTFQMADDRWFEVRASGLRPDGLLAVVRDISDRVRLDELVDGMEQHLRILEHQALHDPLTGLANRLLVESRIEHSLSRLERHATKLAVMFLDLDGLKAINDADGHAVGDALLVEIGRRLKGLARPYDTVGRVGGDEFVVVCEDLDDDDAADQIARRFVSACAAPLAIDGHEVASSVSIGVAVTGSGTIDVARLLHDADAAMYQAKANGGNRVEYADPVLHEHMLVRHDVEIGLEQAIRSRALRIDYEPVVSVADRQVVGLRASAGWSHPDHGHIGDETLAAAAARTGMGASLADHLLDDVIAHAASWLGRCAVPAGRFVIANVDGAVLTEHGFVERLTTMLERHHVDAANVCLAVDGLYIASHSEAVKVVFDRLDALGVRTARDGVEAAGPTLMFFHRLPISMVILDAALIDDVGLGNDEFVGLAIDVAKSSGRLVVAPSVASAAQLDALTRLGADFALGPFIRDTVADPLPCDPAAR